MRAALADADLAGGDLLEIVGKRLRIVPADRRLIAFAALATALSAGAAGGREVERARLDQIVREGLERERLAARPERRVIARHDVALVVDVENLGRVALD